MKMVSHAKLKTKEAGKNGQLKQSKWDKAFWAREYYVSTIGNITEDTIKKYIQEQAEELRKEDSRSPSL